VLGRVGSSDLGHQPILGSRVAHQLLAALPDSERAFWATALFCGLRRGELRGLQWLHVDFEDDVIRVERSWDPVKGPVDVKTGAGHRAVPMAFVVRRELRDHQHRTGRGGEDLVFGRTATEAFFASTIRCRANRAWQAAGLQPLTPHEARHCAISYFIAAGSAPESSALEEEICEPLPRHSPPSDAAGSWTVAQTMAHDPKSTKPPSIPGVSEYRYRDSNPGFRRERAAS
jgi:integrase